MSRTLVAVYGTLREGEYNNHLLYGAKKLATTRLKEKAAMYDNGYFPYLNLGKPETNITVEVYEVDEPILMGLNRLEGWFGEGENNHYERSLVEVEGLEEQVLIYHNPGYESERPIESGDWFVK